MTKAEAIALRDEVDAAIDAAQQLGQDRLHMGAINWGDLSCRDVEERKSLISDSVAIVAMIEEASPDANGLLAFVGEWLKERGWKDVYVETEW